MTARRSLAAAPLLPSTLVAALVLACSPAAPAPDVVDAVSARDAPAAARSIALAPADLRLVIGRAQPLSAQLTLSDGHTRPALAGEVRWSSSAPALASVDADGVVSALAEGSATISAAIPSASASALVRVVAPDHLDAIELSPQHAQLWVHLSQPFTAVARYADGATRPADPRLTWTSSNPDVGSVDGRGVVLGSSEGTTEITASVGSVRSNTATLVVRAPTIVSIAVTPVTATLRGCPSAPGTRLTATAQWDDASTSDVTTTATWRSSAPAVATVSNAPGLQGSVTPSGASGTANITAVQGGITSSPAVISILGAATLARIDVTPAEVTLVPPAARELTATATYEDGRTGDVTTMATWSSSDTSVATVDAAGRVGSVAPGTAVMRAELPTGNCEGAIATDTAAVTVTAP